MKFIALCAIANAIKINDQETCNSSGCLAQDGPEVEALAQVDESFTIDGATGDIASADKLSNDMVHIGKTLGCSNGAFSWGTFTPSMNGGSDKDLHAFLVSIWELASEIKGTADAQTTSLGNLETQITNT